MVLVRGLSHYEIHSKRLKNLRTGERTYFFVVIAWTGQRKKSESYARNERTTLNTLVMKTLSSFGK